MIAAEFDIATEELLYSAIARFRTRMRYPTEGCIWEALYGVQSGVATIELPGYLREMVHRLGMASNLTLGDLIGKHTTLPYYAPFVSPAHAVRASDTLSSGTPSALYGLLGIRASTVHTPAAMRYCARCVEDDRARLGSATWRRCHQLPGVVMCDVHHTILHESAVVRSNRCARPVFWSADECIAEEDPPAWTGPQPEFLGWAACATSALLRDARKPPGLAVIRARYQTLVRDAGYGRGASRIAMARLYEAFVAHHSPALLRALGCALAPDPGTDSWLARLLRRPRAARHPLHHLLLLHFLGAAPDEVLAPKHRHAASGADSRPPCRNRVCSLAEPTAQSQPAAVVQEHTCPRCGYSYRRASGEAARTVVLTYGPLWEGRLRSLVGDSAVGLRAAARLLGIDPKTLKRHAARLGLPRPGWKTVQSDPHRRTGTAAQDRHRAAWLALRASQPSASVQKLRAQLPATYTYLYRSDRAWFDENRPSRAQLTQCRARVDWTARDRDLLEKARDAVRRIVSQPTRPVRLSRALIGRTAGQLALVEQHLDRLPRTRAYLASIVETRAQYARRRIRWSADAFIGRGTIPEPWVLVKAAGLRTDLAAELRAEIALEVERIAQCLCGATVAA